MLVDHSKNDAFLSIELSKGPLFEESCVEDLAETLSARGLCFFQEAKARAAGGDPPDCEAIDDSGRRIAIEVVRLCDPEAEAINREKKKTLANEPYSPAYRVWNQEEYTDKVRELLRKKGEKGRSLKGGPYDGGFVVLIRSNELQACRELVEIWMRGEKFLRPQGVDRAFLVLSYEPGFGYPTFELDLI